MVAYCLPSPYVTLWADTVRDLGASLSLARGQSIPLTGPGPINFGPYAGPAWVWLQALPLFAWPSFVATSVFVAIVGSLKFPLLYELGRRAAGARLGICLAVAAAYPTFAAYQWIMFYHPNWVETCVTATLVLFLVADQRKSLRLAYAGAAMLGLAVQIHTTTLFYLPVGALVLHRIGVRGPRLVAHFAAMCAVVAAWFIPVFFAPPAARGTLQGATQRVAADMMGFDVGAVFTVLRTAYVDIPLAVGETYATNVPPAAWAAGLAIVAAAGAIGFARQVRRNGFVMLAIAAALLAAWVIAAAVRSYTSFYLAYFLLPLSAIVLGASLEGALASPSRWVRALSATAMALLVASFIVSALGARSVGRSGLLDTRLLAMGDLKHPVDMRVAGVIASSAARDSFARDACSRAGPVYLHGELAYAVSSTMGLDFRMHCPGRPFAILGAEPGAHLAALPVVAAAALGIAHGAAHRGLRVMNVARAIYPVEGRPIGSKWDYFEELRDRVPPRSERLDFETGARQLVAIHRFKPFDSLWRLSVERDGVAVKPVYETFNSWVYAGDAPGKWRVEFETDAPQWVDVYLLDR
jgi:hypothetical protein